MTDLTDLWDLPEPHGYHDHEGSRCRFTTSAPALKGQGRNRRT